jgi:hypothetical protein
MGSGQGAPMRFSKRQGNLAIPLVVAMLAPFSGCKGSNDLTGMGQTVQTPTPTVKTPTPTPPDLRGTWTGTLHAVGATDEFFCPSGGSVIVTVPIDQNGNAVTYSVPSSARCLHDAIVHFRGTLVADNQLSGIFDVSYPADPSCTLTGVAGGTVSASTFHLQGVAEGPCNAVQITFDLSKQ